MLIQTIKNKMYSTIDSRAINHNGCVVDIGCLNWDWSKFFINKKRIIGVDPFENEIDGVELFKGLIGAVDGECFITNSGVSSSIYTNNTNGEKFPMLSWKKFCQQYQIIDISILKMNIEGGEYDLLNSLDSDDFSKIDQMAISFHDRKNTEWRDLTKMAINRLKDIGYQPIQICTKWNWFLFLKI